MVSLEVSSLLFAIQYNPKELGYYSDVAVLLECASEMLSIEANKPQRVETLECRLIQELTRNCIKV